MGVVWLPGFYYIAAMFIRQVKKKNTKDGKTFFQYQLVQASRVQGKVKQQALLYLGSETLLDDKANRKMVLDVLQALIFGQPLLFAASYPERPVSLAHVYFEKFKIKYPEHQTGKQVSLPPKNDGAKLEEVDTSSLEIEDARTFGGEHLCAQIMEKLQLSDFLRAGGFSEEEANLANISIIARALFASSEHKTSQYLRDNSELQHLYAGREDNISHQALYKISDKLYENKNHIDRYLYHKVTDLFGLKDSLVIYDLSNTYFEGRKSGSKLAGHGRSKEKRNDCKQVVFSGVINSQGFIRHSRIYEGSTADVVTLKDMVADLEEHSSVAGKVVVLDAGFASEENLDYLRARGLRYVCVSRKQMKDFQPSEHFGQHALKDKRGHGITLEIFRPDGHQDTWMCVESEQKRVKEQSMSLKLSDRFEQELAALSDGLSKKRTVKKLEKVYERIGRIRQKHKMVSGNYEIKVEPDKQSEKAKKVTWHKKESPAKEHKEQGRYFIRTDIEDARETMIWEIYNTVREVEATFRCLKSDLLLRPVYHQNDERVESHLYLAMLAYQLVNTIRHMLKQEGINHDWKNIVRIMNTQKTQSVLLKTKTKLICIRKPSRPMSEVLGIYKATGTKSMIAAQKKYVVYH
jgi:transposase